ncbi:hypothetical protein Pla175_13790 [Pirellulimonas nuda]|uniref:Pheromone autoinducer 2 transporter n=1 Tax=Pirellulimonas nuda TaxID=2528009 RepID=A0A518D978_9BACT|nr:AI-2E family transporter [Pirellulimonas nuda]QDU88010.1 hypothetical protein Pla175_13790 [Pirellulimonas nuda]
MANESHSTAGGTGAPDVAALPRVSPSWGRIAKRALIWALFLLLIYATRDFFAIAFMTFLFSYLALSIVDRCVARLAPGSQSAGLRRLLTLAVFLVGPTLLLVVGALVMPSLVAECQHLAGWASRLSPESEAAQLMEKVVGPAEFRRTYGDASDERYQAAYGEFRDTGRRHTQAYLSFPKLEDWVEGGFHRQLAETQAGAARAGVLGEGVSSPAFVQWVRRSNRADVLGDEAAAAGPSSAGDEPPSADELLAKARHDPALLARLRQAWLDDTAHPATPAGVDEAAYRRQFRAFYEALRAKSPHSLPYSFDQFVSLQAARPQGAAAFAEALEGGAKKKRERSESELQADFEAAQSHRLFQSWWATSSLAKMTRQWIDANPASPSADYIEGILASLLNLPVGLASALLLSFFICIDFPTLRVASRRLRDTWLRDAYDEVVPALTRLGGIIAQAMRAQGGVALCNATILLVGLAAIGVEHAALLAAAAFVLCLVPTLGVLFAWALIGAIALIQPGGGLGLAMKASGVVMLVVVLETFVFSPRILGKLLDLHPVVSLAILPVAHYFFGVWGLILAVPVCVYLINDVIMMRSAGDPAKKTDTPA